MKKSENRPTKRVKIKYEWKVAGGWNKFVDGKIVPKK